jgi:hypothetical protein
MQKQLRGLRVPNIRPALVIALYWKGYCHGWPRSRWTRCTALLVLFVGCFHRRRLPSRADPRYFSRRVIAILYFVTGIIAHRAITQFGVVCDNLAFNTLYYVAMTCKSSFLLQYAISIPVFHHRVKARYF